MQQAGLFNKLLIIVCLLFLPGTPSLAEPVVTFLPPTPEQANTGKGLLWKIQTPQGRTSYLFGTIHVDDPDVINLPNEITRPFNRCRSLTLELLPDPSLALQSAGAMLFQDGRTLASVSGEQLAKRSVAAMQARGMPETMTMQMKPWAVMMTLSVPQNTSGQFLDFRLHARAKALGMNTHALETYAEQVSVFEGMTMNEQTRMLQHTLDALPRLPLYFAQLKQAWLARDLDQLQSISDQQMPDNDPAGNKLMQNLVGKRNHKMLERLQPRLQEGNAFIAVGALHLPGPDGLIRLLRDKGNSVTAVY